MLARVSPGSSWLAVTVVWAVPALVVPTMEAMDVDVPVAPRAPALPAPVLVTTVAVAAPAAPEVSSGRAAPASAVAPMATAAFAVAMVPEAPVLPAPETTTPVATPVALPVALDVPEAPVAQTVPFVSPSLINTMVQDEKRVYLLFTCLLVLLSKHHGTRSQTQIRDQNDMKMRAWGFVLVW